MEEIFYKIAHENQLFLSYPLISYQIPFNCNILF